MNFSHRLSTILKQHGFIPSVTNAYNTAISSFTKENGGIWHIVLVGDLDILTIDEFQEVSEKYYHFYSLLPLDKKPNHIFVTHLLLSSEPNPAAEAFLAEVPPFNKGFVSNVFWGFNPQTGAWQISKNMPSKMLNLRKLINDAYENNITYRKPLQPIGKGILTHALVIVNIIVYGLLWVSGGVTLENLLHFGALSPEHILEQGEYHRLITAMFLHGNNFHLVFNMLALYLFGTRVEKYYGASFFALIYTFSGLVGSIASVFFSQTVSVGASGAIFGLIGATFSMSFFFKRHIDGLNHQSILSLILINIGMGFAMPGIDNFGHMGGLVAGLLMGYALCWRYKQ